MSSFKELIIIKDRTIIDAMKQIDKMAKKIVFVVDKENKLIGSLTDGDIRRWIIKGGSLDATLEKPCYKKTYFVYQNYNIEEVKKKMLSKKFVYVPVVNKNKIIQEFIEWDSLFKESFNISVPDKIDLPLVIMAGGKGTRLDPFTQILPKMLIPIDNKSLLEIIIEKFAKFSISDFYLTLNYKAYLVKYYLAELNLPYNIHYIKENKPLGTAGSLYMLKTKLTTDFILTNCDIIIEADYYAIIQHHYSQKNDITMVVSMKHFIIPYGICEIKNGGQFLKINEKPHLNFLVNTGMYIVNKDIINLIPEEQIFHMTDLIKKAKISGKKIGIYPISENSWIDTGEWDEYKKAVERLKI